MGLKLRAIVTHVATPGGALLRMGDRTVALSGARAYASFRQLARLLDGRWTHEELCASGSEPARPAIAKLLDSLKAAGMVYTPHEDGGPPDHADRMGNPDSAADIARIESTSSRPVAAFRDARVRRVHVAAPSWMSDAIRAACQDLGLSQATSCDDAADDGRLSLIDTGTTVLAGPFAGPGRAPAGCAACLAEAYAYSTPAPAPHAIEARRRQAAAELAARVLVQRWLDCETGVANLEDAMLVYEVDVETLAVTARPLPPRPACAQCGSEPTVARAPGTPPQIGDVLARAHRYLTDPVTGLFISIGEGALLQLPHKQSMVHWRHPHDRARRLWTTDAADDVRSARLGALRAALEAYLGDLIPDARGLVISGASTDELRAREALAAVTLLAEQRDAWTRIEVDPDSLAGDRAALTLAYLEDSGHAPRVRVWRDDALSQDACQVLRFTCDAVPASATPVGTAPASIVAGAPLSDVLAVGLRDVWLHVTAAAVDRLPPDARRPVIRHRHVLTSDAAAWTTRLGLEWESTPLTWPVLQWVQPLAFAYVRTRGAESVGRVDEHQLEQLRDVHRAL